METFDILDPSVDVFCSRLLEASAGTGKTFAIEHLFVRLLVESTPPIALAEILAVTFTRRAAAEMKGRIRSKLLSMGREGGLRVQRALAQFDTIQVFTIHGFCHRMLSEYAFEAGAPLKPPSPDRGDYLRQMRRTVEDFFCIADPKYACETTALIKRSRFDLDRLIEQVLAAMQRGGDPDPVNFPDLPEISHEELASDLEQLVPRYKRLNSAMWQAQLGPFVRYLKEGDPRLLLEEPRWFFEQMGESNAKVKAPPLETLALSNRPFFEALQTRLVPALATFRDPAQMLKRMAAECRRHWVRKASRGDYLTFDALLSQMGNALKRPAFKRHVQSRYNVLIVDEFQDTDATQMALFEELFFDRHLIYLVGDPKQSIYSFRGGDIYTYMRAADQFGSRRSYLDTNFRSSPPLVEALNTLFTQRPDWIELPSLPGALRYHPVKAGRKGASLEGPPLVFFGAKGERGSQKSFPTHSMEEALLFPYIAAEILRLSGQVAFDRMAILIRDRYHAQRLHLHLNRWQIPSAIERTLNLVHARGFLEMELFLRALCDPSSPTITRAATRGGDHNPFYSLRALFDVKGFATCFRSYLEGCFDGHADRELRDGLIQTAELLMEYKGASPDDLVQILQKLKSQSPEADPRLKLRSQQGGGQVGIMTTFASKGLEFDVVFALGMAYRCPRECNRQQRAELMRQLYVAFTRARERLYIPYVVETSGKGDKLSPSAIDLLFDREPAGIFWVTPTPIHPQRSQDPLPDVQPPPAVELARTSQTLCRKGGQPCPEGGETCALDRDTPYVTSFSAMAKPQALHVVRAHFDRQDLTVQTPHTLPLGAETGVAIHQIFERHFFSRKIAIDQIVSSVLSCTHLKGWKGVVGKMIERALELELMPGFCLRDLAEGDFLCETEFLYPEGNRWIKGVCDLIFRKGDTCYLLDWKTNWVGPSEADYTPQALGAVVREHAYDLQASLYAEAVKRYVGGCVTHHKYGGAYYVFVRGNQVVHLGTG